MANNPPRLSISGTALPLAFFTLFFLLNGTLGFLSIRNIERNQQAVNQSLQHINSINEVFVELLRAESGQRGYLLTDLDSYARPYEEALQVLDERLHVLLDAEFDQAQRNRLYQLQLLMNEKVEEMTDSVSALRENEESMAIQLLFSHRGRNIMIEINDLIEQMKDHEREIMNQRLVASHNARSTSIYLTLLANGVGLLMVFVTMALVRRNLRKEEEFALTLQQANDSLEAKVEERTAALSHYSNELKRSNRELQDFAFVASHDLQEPLRKIRAFGDRLQHHYEAQLDQQGVDYIRRMQNASERMSRLIADLLSFSRITSNNEPFESIALDEVVDEVLEDLEIAIEESGADVQVGELPEIEADRFQMKQLFQNLIGNALKFRQPGQAPRIRVDAAVEDRADDGAGPALPWTAIRVADNGIGFDEKFHERIFTPFQRLHGKSEYSGTGIGLALCRRIVERHGGRIEVHSIAGEGSTFIIHLPAKSVVYALGDEAESG